MTIQATLWDFQTLELVESKKAGVLGVVKGEFFYENRPSRNRRIYPTGLWEKQLGKPHIKSLLADGLMIGTIGHEDVSADTLIREGKVSHRTTKLTLDSVTGIGLGEAEILDTPIGRIVHTLIKSGSKLAVSSKAIGESKGKDKDGNDIVDAERFGLERFDFVTDPGFLTARPDLREQLEEAFKEDTTTLTNRKEEIKNLSDNNFKNGGCDMDLAEKLMKEKTELENELGSVTEKLNSKNIELSGFNKDVDNYKDEIIKLTEENEAFSEAAEKSLEFFTEHGNAAEIEEALNISKSTLDQLEELGTLEDIVRLSEAYEEQSNRIAELGTLDNIEKAFAQCEDVIANILDIGTLDNIQESIDVAASYINDDQEEQKDEAVTSLSAKYGVEDSKVSNMLESMSIGSAVGILEDLKSNDILVSSKSTENNIDEDSNGGVNQDYGSGNRAARLMESFI